MKRLLFAATLAVLALAGCDETEEAVAPQPRAVRAMVVAADGEAARRTLPGVLTAAETMQLAFPIAGRLIEAPLREGDGVAQGQVVARLDPDGVQREIDAAEANVAAARAALDVADAEFERQNTLFDRGIASRAAFDRASGEVAAVLAARRVAETQLAAAEDRLDRITLTAPSDGVVTRLLANRFEELSAGQPVYDIAVTEALQAEVLAPEALLAALGPGAAADVRLPAFPGLTIRAHVTEIAAQAEAGAAFRVTVRLENPPEGAKTGFSAAVTFPLPRRGGVMDLPLAALLFEGASSPPTAGDTAAVWVFDAADSVVRRREVRIEGVVGADVLVTEGLSPGERVVTAGVALLTEGEAVRLWSLPE